MQLQMVVHWYNSFHTRSLCKHVLHWKGLCMILALYYLQSTATTSREYEPGLNPFTLHPNLQQLLSVLSVSLE